MAKSRKIMNRRARRAYNAICKEYGSFDAETSIRDLIADLMHLSQHTGINFMAEFESAENHFKAEKR
jgi:hypothetical protein